MTRAPLALLGLLALAACATPERGIPDRMQFAARAERTTFPSPRPAEDVAACFRDTAVLLPSSTLLIEPEAAGATYELGAFGTTFEQIRFRPAEAGSTATVLLAPGLKARWRADLERDRLAPLRACLG